MKILKPTYEVLFPKDLNGDGKKAIYESIETAARTCYKSTNNGSEEKQKNMLLRLIQGGHEAMLEHASITVRFTVDRGVTHELVRHRIASFAQESTRYCNYSKDKFGNECSFIDLSGGLKGDSKQYDEDTFNQILAEWCRACEDSEKHYLKMIEIGATPQMARSVLNNSVKTEIVVTASIREWRHILELRAVGTTGTPHPQIKEVMIEVLHDFANAMPELFGDIERLINNAEE